MADGLSNHDIPERLVITEGTLEALRGLMDELRALPSGE
jgi:hypothetical protein